MTKLNFALVAIAFASSTVFAAPSGFLSVNSCTGGGVTVTSTTIDWLLPAAGTIGCSATNTGTNVTYSGGGPLLAGDITGQIKDAPAASNADFLIWTDQPNLHFDLVTLGPGSLNTSCSPILDPNAPVCSVVAGSPFLLKPTATGTAVSLSAAGTARDSSTVTSTWLGDFSTQFPGITPAQLQAAIVVGTPIAGFCADGACTNSYTGSFLVRANAGAACPATLGFWKNAAKHPFPSTVQSAGGLTIGGHFYTVCDLRTILNNNGGNAIAILGRQLVAAMLNSAAGGQDNDSADAAVGDAQNLLQGHGLNLLTSTIDTSSALGVQLISDAAILDGYNNANYGSCSEGAGLQLGGSSSQCP